MAWLESVFVRHGELLAMLGTALAMTLVIAPFAAALAVWILVGRGYGAKPETLSNRCDGCGCESYILQHIGGRRLCSVCVDEERVVTTPSAPPPIPRAQRIKRAGGQW